MSGAFSAGGLAVEVRPPIGEGAGAGPLPYLLVHGSMDRSTSFRRVAARLPAATLITYDRRGYAGSSSVEVSDDFATQVVDLLEVVDGRPVVALGHSLGGTIVLAAAVARPDLVRAALVWEPPVPWLPGWPARSGGARVVADRREPAEVAESFMVRMVGERVWSRLPEATRQARRSEGPALIAEMRALRGGAPWQPDAVRVPVTVGTGSDSLPHQRDGAATLARLLPDAEFVVVPDATHGAHLSRPAELAGLLERVAARASVGTDGPAGQESATTAERSRS